MTTNRDRALLGNAAISTYVKHADIMAWDKEITLSNLLCDLMHWAPHDEPVDFSRALCRAICTYENESAEAADDETPHEKAVRILRMAKLKESFGFDPNDQIELEGRS